VYDFENLVVYHYSYLFKQENVSMKVKQYTLCSGLLLSRSFLVDIKYPLLNENVQHTIIIDINVAVH